MSGISIWIQAARPKTLWAAFAPVLIGTAMAAGDGVFHPASAFMALLGAMLIQVGTNFCNDYFDFKHGADTAHRVGPVRATQAGLVSPASMARATAIVFALAAAVCGWLVWRAGWPLAVVGAASIVCGALYTAGPFPLAYIGLGDLFVLIFFGPVAVAGTYFVQALTLPAQVALAGVAPGLLAVAILTVNNLRDVDTDRAAGKKTLAVRFGVSFARSEYVACVLGAIALALALRVWLVALALLFAVPVLRGVLKSEGAALNPMLGRTALLMLAYSVLFSIGWLW